MAQTKDEIALRYLWECAAFAKEGGIGSRVLVEFVNGKGIHALGCLVSEYKFNEPFQLSDWGRSYTPSPHPTGDK